MLVTRSSALLRFADWQFLALLFQLPPRITRFEPVGHHPKSMQHVPPPGLAVRGQGERHQPLHPLLQLQLRPPPGHPLAFIPTGRWCPRRRPSSASRGSIGPKLESRKQKWTSRSRQVLECCDSSQLSGPGDLSPGVGAFDGDESPAESGDQSCSL